MCVHAKIVDRTEVDGGSVFGGIMIIHLGQEKLSISLPPGG